MRSFRLGRAYARLLCPLVATATVLVGPSLSSAAERGLVVDQQGRPLPHARVHVVLTPSTATGRPRDGAAAATGADRSSSLDLLTDDAGTFALPDDISGGCTLEVSLTGFTTSSVPCPSGTATARVTLQVAPVAETVIVTGTRTAAVASQTGLSSTTFTNTDIARRQQPFVSELLRSVPGAMVTRTGGPGGVTGLFVRGGESNYNTVLLDGIPLNEPGGTFNFNALTSENLERIEVVRGANSALFGSDAMSSVVQLFTRRFVDDPSQSRTSVQLDGGSYGTGHFSATTTGMVKGTDFSLGAARFTTDNRVANSGFDSTTLSATAGRGWSAASVRGVFRAELGRTGTSGQTAYGRPDLDAFYEHHDLVGGLTVDGQLTTALHQRATYSFYQSNQVSTNLVEDAPYTPSYEGRVAPFEFYDFTFDSHNALRRHHASYQLDWSGAATNGRLQRVTALADWNGERATLEDRLATTTSHASRDNVGASLQHELIASRVSTTAGFRFERNASFGTALVPRVSASVVLHDGSAGLGETRLHAAGGLGIKEPTVLQSFSTSPYFTGNPDLKPERSRAVEAGVTQRFAGDRAKVDATYFDNRYRNIIGLLPTGGFTSQYFNIGVTRARGVELSAEVAPYRALRLSGGLSFLDSKILASTNDFSPVFAVGEAAFRRPRHSGFAQVSWATDRITSSLLVTSIGRFSDSDFSSLEPAILLNAGRTTADARLSVRLWKKVSGLLNIDNLTGRNYQEPLGYFALQRTVRTGIRIEY